MVPSLSPRTGVITPTLLTMDDGAFDPDRELPAIRASDAERETTVHTLQESYAEGRLTLAEFDERTSQAYGARFQSDLIALTRDLSPAHRQPENRPDNRAEFRSEAPPMRRVTGEGGTSTSLAILGGCDRKGVWTLSPVHTTVAVMGGVTLDLRQAHLHSHETTIRAFAIMGGIEILVPDDVHLDVEGIGLMGGFGEDMGGWGRPSQPVRQAPPGAPRIRITGFAVWAGVGIRRVPREPENS